VSGDVTTELGEDRVALVEVHRAPDNFFDVEMISALADAFESLAQDDRCRAIVLASEGKNFCAGAQFSAAGRGFEDGENAIPSLYREAARMMRAPLPVVAAVQGAAVGGGLGLACAADFRVACPSSKFSANFARLGFHQGFGLSVTLPRIVGQQGALELLYSGRRIAGDAAREMGLVDRLVDEAELRASAHELAGEVAASAPLAVRSIRATMRAGMLGELEGALEREAAEQARLRETADWNEGVRAMSERRAPRFEGR
jgi:enoyl-CoA hydratase/carnithine racemase